MTSTQQPSGDRPSSAEDAYALLLELREQGSAPDFETWVREYPEFERELRALEESWVDIEDSLERVLAPGVLVPSEPLVPSLAPGLVVGEFRLLRRIGAGGMGVVWLARQPALDRDVALKFVRPDRETAQSAELFAREARAAGRARDARIATVYAVGENAGHRWLAQEYVQGSRGLAHWLRELQDSGIPPGHDRRAAAFVADVAEALHAAHELGVVHRDVKPQNLLMAPDGRPKITDFGLARLLDEAALSETLAIRGTVEYMSPEQVSGATHDIDRRSDVFSLGVVLYELLTLQRPFRGATPLEIIAAVSVREARPPSELRPGLAPELDVIAQKALEKQPGARYPTALELARDLRRWLAHEPIAARPPSLWRRVAKWMRRNPTGTVLAGALAAVAGLLLLGFTILGQARSEVIEHKKRAHVLQLHLDIDDGRLDEAALQVAAFGRIDDGDPEAHLVLAMGYARYLRFAEAEVELAQALRLGFDPEPGPEPTAQELYLSGLWWIAQRDRQRQADAADLLERAVALDERMDQVWFPLYQVRKITGDTAGARAALVRFIGSLEQRDDFTGVAQALLAELDGEHLRAVEILRALGERIDDARASELRLHRHLGRNYLLAYLDQPGARPELLDAAEAELRRAVADLDDDGNAWAALAMIAKRRADLVADPEARERLRALAEELAARATDRGLGLEMGTEVLLMVAYDRFAGAFDPQRSAESDLDEIERLLDALKDLDADSPQVANLRSCVAYYRGAFAFERGDTAGARAHWMESVEAWEHQLYARVSLAQRLYMDDEDYAGAIALLREALSLWDSRLFGVPGWDPSLERKWLFAAAIWLFGAADHAGDVELAREAAERAMEELERDDTGARPQEIESLAEFFAVPVNSVLQDCETALTLLEEYEVDAYFKGDAVVETMLADIHAACDRSRK